MSTCCGVFLKIVSGIFTACFTIVGIGLTAFSAFSTYTLFIINSDDTIKQHLTVVPSIITFVIGICLLVLIVLGYCGILTEAPCCMVSYSVFLILLSLIQIGLGTYCLITYSSIETKAVLKDRIESDIRYAVETYRSNPHTMDTIQRWLKCCGTDNSVDDYAFYESDLPPSCCEDMVTCLKYSPTKYREGCSEQVYIFTVGTNFYLGWISVIVGATELVGALFGICLSCSIWV